MSSPNNKDNQEDNFTPNVPEFDMEIYEIATALQVSPEEALELAIKIVRQEKEETQEE